jgi:four helix bundle protein
MKNRKNVKMTKKLMIWQKSLQLVNAAGCFRKQFLPGDIFGLSYAIRRSTVSVSSHIAEAFEIQDPSNRLRILQAAQSSLAEFSQHLIMAGRKMGCNTNKIRIEAEQVSVQLESYINALRK